MLMTAYASSISARSTCTIALVTLIARTLPDKWLKIPTVPLHRHRQCLLPKTVPTRLQKLFLACVQLRFLVTDIHVLRAYWDVQILPLLTTPLPQTQTTGLVLPLLKVVPTLSPPITYVQQMLTTAAASFIPVIPQRKCVPDSQIVV
jgi:hypothetical protein